MAQPVGRSKQSILAHTPTLYRLQSAAREGCGGFIDEEIWLVDNKSSACTGNPFEMCWVEAGYTIDEGQSPVFFWADGRPLKQSTYNLHLLGKTDPVGATNHFMIIKDGRVTPKHLSGFYL
jgi:hypothetical protein